MFISRSMMAEFFFLKAYIIGAVERKNGDDDAPLLPAQRSSYNRNRNSREFVERVGIHRLFMFVLDFFFSFLFFHGFTKTTS